MEQGRFELSERWCGWKHLDAIFVAARAAIEAGPLDPLVCEVVFDADFEPWTVDGLEEAREHLLGDSRVMSMDISLSHIDDEQALIVLHYNGHWLQLNGYGSDWDRVRPAYYAAQEVLAGHHGITTFKLPEPPRDTVAETRKRLEIEELERALDNVDESLKDL